MGTWGTRPWDNDTAADWFGNMMDMTGLAKYVEETLHREIEEGFPVYADEIRAAASVLILLGHTFIWPVDDLDRHLELAVSRLDEILQKGYGSHADEQIRAEIDVLKSRIGGGHKGDSSDAVRWWHY